MAERVAATLPYNRRIADLETGKVKGIPLEETLAKARKITGQ